MSYCTKCGRIYASSWQAERCCSFTSIYDDWRKQRPEQTRPYRSAPNIAQMTTGEKKVVLALFCAWLALVNPWLAGFLFIMFMLC